MAVLTQTNLVTENIYGVYALLTGVEFPLSAITTQGVGVVDADGNPRAAQALGPIPGEHVWFGRRTAHHWPYYRVHAALDETLRHRPHEGMCLSLRHVRERWGGGYVLNGPLWLVEGDALAWSHDGRFHHGCPEAPHA